MRDQAGPGGTPHNRDSCSERRDVKAVRPRSQPGKFLPQAYVDIYGGERLGMGSTAIGREPSHVAAISTWEDSP
jgi:hypothetical protein